MAASAGGPNVALGVWVTQSQEAFPAMLKSVVVANPTTQDSHVSDSSILLSLRNRDAQTSVSGHPPSTR